jgi:GNAT superfamily N-acetyltransferase
MEGYQVREYLKPGDIGKIVLFHGQYYSKRLGLNEEFEAYVAVPLSEFALRKSPVEKIWIIESDEQLIGTITLTKVSVETAQLRWFYVLPEYHGRGLGKLLMEKLLEFAGRKGYREITLGTVDSLKEAISLYKKYGFKLVDSHTHFIWGQTTTEETYLKIL